MRGVIDVASRQEFPISEKPASGCVTFVQAIDEELWQRAAEDKGWPVFGLDLFKEAFVGLAWGGSEVIAPQRLVFMAYDSCLAWLGVQPAEYQDAVNTGTSEPWSEFIKWVESVYGDLGPNTPVFGVVLQE